MRILSFAVFIATIACSKLDAGSINVVHLGPGDVVKFEVRAGDAAQDFTLAHGADSGPFLLPEKPITIKCFVDGVPSLEVPLSEKPRIALLIPSAKGYEWRLQDALPSPEKWALRIVNLASEPVEVKSTNSIFKIPSGKEKVIKVSKQEDLKMKISDTVDLAYGGTEPRGIVAFVYQEQEKWRAVFLPDR
ncbi:MAG: hypothetical protein AB8D78_09775 [Akkermansiaceae bacterium]